MSATGKKVDGRRLAGPKISATNRSKWGADYYSRIGAMGGKARVPKGPSLSKKKAAL